VSVKRVLNRLLRIRELEEEQSRLEFEFAVANRDRVFQARSAAVARQALGRSIFVAEASNRDTAGRTGAVIEMEQARRLLPLIEAHLAPAEAEVERKREAFLERRVARLQVETLESEERLAVREETARRAQQMLDDWYGRRPQKRGDRPGNESSLPIDSDRCSTYDASFLKNSKA
jgi:hypothetical protein